MRAPGRKRMRILTRYILREVTSHALLGGALFTFIIFTRSLGPILDAIVRDSASFGDVVRIIACTLPNVLNITIPMAVLVGILLGLSRLAADSEVTAMRAAGIGAIDFVRIVSIVSAVALIVGLFNSLYLAPRAAAGIISLGESLKSSQASFEVQPHVFYEEFKNRVLYIQDVTPAAGAALWHHVFLADITQPADPHITTAEQAIVVNGTPNTADAQTIRLHLLNGGQHDTSATDPNQYNISTFTTTDIPIETEATGDTHLGHLNTSIEALSLPELWRRANAQAATNGRTPSIYRIEFNKRFSYPFACLVLMLVGVPLGISSKRGGKSTGFVLTIVLVFIYYFLSSVGVAFAQSGRLSPFLGVWGANLLFAAAGAILLYQMSRGGIALSIFSSIGVWLNQFLTRLISSKQSPNTRSRHDVATWLRRFRNVSRIQFPLLLDDYVMREYATNFSIVLFSFSCLFLIFTFFELIGPIFRNQTPLFTVGEYLINLIPYILYNVTPLCALVAVLVTFGALNRSSELTAMKSSGISLYRIITPILVVTIVISAGLFVFDEFYLPAANRRQEALLSVIKNKPTQTFSRPDRQWISGQTNNAGEPARIFYYQYFNAETDKFANLTVFEFDPATFTLQRRIFAASARWDPQVNNWVFDNGWQRTFSGETIATYQPFTVAAFPEIREQPSYFKKEYIPSQEMSYNELSSYIADLKQSGFETKRLSVQLNKKIAYPLITLVMAILAIPFALSMGKKGSLTGIATAIGLAITYSVVALIFESLGNVNILPAVLAAWTPDLLFGITGAYLLLRTPT
jgi:LPS export ABC transporter permease LptG/LPS export ABC transporter permease LptF